MDLKAKKVAIVHDFLGNYGGAEGVLEAICEIFPEAPIFTLLCDKKAIEKWDGNWVKNRKIEESFLKKAPDFLKKRKKYLLPFMPAAIEALSLRDYDLIISSSGAFSKGIVIKPKTTHICYLHSPMRYVWDWNSEYLNEQKIGGKRKLLTRLFLNYLRTWDRASADRPDFLVVNSKYTAQRVNKYYRRDCKVIYPPVKIDDIPLNEKNEGFFLTVGRLTPYKKTSLIIDTFAKLKLPLIIVGEGAEGRELKEKIQQSGNDRIKLVGWQTRENLIKLYQRSRAFIFSAEDDFGIAPVEAMAAGKPVIALRAGGAIETVIEGATGEFFDQPKMEMLADGVRKFIENEKNYNPQEIRRQAEKFSKEKFKKNLEEYIKIKINTAETVCFK